ncbi:hypothetical protein LXA43DRAFT_897961 [Ganoderma leucocontextum]|nr:hypothetical protein LXA43DRAFT_897961 [Ganoderma leucocontextum]
MPGSSPPPVASLRQAVPPTPNPPDSSHVALNARNRAPDLTHPLARPSQQQPPPQAHPPHRPPFSWSSSLLTMLTTIACFAVLCVYASAASTRFALHAAAPVYGLYPALVAAMLVGGCCALICYLPTMLAVLAFQLLFDTDIRKRHTPPPGPGSSSAHPLGQRQGAGELGWSVLHDGASTIKLALVVAPVYVMALGRAGSGGVESRALDAAAGGQLAAAVMTLRIMLVGVGEIWDLVPLVMFRWDRDARAQAH